MNIRRYFFPNYAGVPDDPNGDWVKYEDVKPLLERIKMIHINKITEHEDGSATVEVEMAQETYRKIFDYGLQRLLMKAVETESDNEFTQP